MSAVSRVVVALAALWLALSAGSVGARGYAVDGTDRTRIAPPPGALITPYENSTYRLEVLGDEITIHVEVAPLQSRAMFRLPQRIERDAVGRVAGSIAAGARTQYEAVSSVLGWVARNVRYELDRSASQEATAVLSRRTAYCTGSARVTVALLAALGVSAREVSGYVVGEGPGDEDGFHRWIEVFYEDRGWVFSDPMATHHFVPATYVRLGSSVLVPARGLQAVLLERDDQLLAADVHPWAPARVTARKNSPRQLAGALRVRVDAGQEGTAILAGLDRRRSRRLDGGQSVFLGLEPGRYLLEVFLDSGEAIRREVELRTRIRSSIYLPSPSYAEDGAAASGPRAGLQRAPQSRLISLPAGSTQESWVGDDGR